MSTKNSAPWPATAGAADRAVQARTRPTARAVDCRGIPAVRSMSRRSSLASFAAFVPVSLPGDGSRFAVTLNPEHRVYLGLPANAAQPCAVGGRVPDGTDHRLTRGYGRFHGARTAQGPSPGRRRLRGHGIALPAVPAGRGGRRGDRGRADDHPVRGKKGHGPVPVDTTVDRVADDSTPWSSRAATRPTSCGARKPCWTWCGRSTTRKADRLHLPRRLGADLGQISRGAGPPAWAPSATTWSTRAPTGWTRPPW